MKASSRFALVLILAGCTLLRASAQVSFTRVMEGELATDPAYFAY